MKNPLINSFKYGNAIKNGIPIAIVGPPNSGKSTLLNKIINERERAIVSNIKGTTRDVIEETFTIEGFQFRFIDTAGLRETNDKMKKIGIKKTHQKIEEAAIIIYVIDINDFNYEQIHENILSFSKRKLNIYFISK